MGIHSLNEFLRPRVPEAFRRLDTRLFARTRIAVDAPLWGYSSLSAAYTNYIKWSLGAKDILSDEPFEGPARAEVRENVCARAKQFVGDLLARGITPVFVFDGTSVAEKTGSARKRRTERRLATEARIAEMRAKIRELEPRHRSPADIEALRNLLKQNPPVNPREDLPYLRRSLAAAGIPCVDAPDEAEKFCAYLASRGVASASWTTDTDSYPFGAPIFITGYEPVPRGEPGPQTWYKATHFTAIMPPVAMRRMNMTRAQFTDMCIMFECDFNSKMDGIGPARAAKLIEGALKKAPDSSRLIEIAAVDAPELPWHVLNAERCRSIFLDDSACAEALARLSLSDLELDREKCSAAFQGQYDVWFQICGRHGAKNVKIRGGINFPAATTKGSLSTSESFQ